MSKLLSRKKHPDELHRTQHITPEIAGWRYIGFDALQLPKDELLEIKAEQNQEICLVIIAGIAQANINEHVLGEIGQRLSPFERTKPYAIYLASEDVCYLVALTDLELGICRAPSKGTFKSRLIEPTDIQSEVLGYGQGKHQIHNILPNSKHADSLLITEVYTTQCCTSSYPNKEQGQVDSSIEIQLEETFYHRIHPSEGFCFQRVFTDDRSLDESMAVHDGDLVLAPKGYHPVATVAGYDSYYLNVKARSERSS